MPDYALILQVFYPDSEWNLTDNQYASLVWGGDTPKPTQKELDALWPAAQKDAFNKMQKRKRQSAYVAESDPLYFKSQRGEATLQEWLDAIAVIDARYPYQT